MPARTPQTWRIAVAMMLTAISCMGQARGFLVGQQGRHLPHGRLSQIHREHNPKFHSKTRPSSPSPTSSSSSTSLQFDLQPLCDIDDCALENFQLISDGIEASVATSMQSLMSLSDTSSIGAPTIPAPHGSSFEVQSHFMTDCAHAVLDFPTILGKPPKMLLNYFNLIGRLLVLSADYIPDHDISIDEFAIQVVLLAMALQEIYNSAVVRRGSKPGAEE